MPSPNVDLLASKLHEWGAMAASMPPAYDAHGVCQPIRGADAREQIGLMLPGRGLYLGHDLKSLGIYKPIPHVFEHTQVRRAIDRAQRLRRNVRRMLRDEKGAITTIDGIVNARMNGQAEDRPYLKTSITTVANSWSSLWQVSGMPAAGAFSATPGVANNFTTTGALSYGLTNPVSGSKYLLSFGFTSSSALNMLLLADILCQFGSLSATSASNQAVASQALTRYTTGAGVNMTFEVTTPIGTTASNIVVTYKNQGGTGGQVTPSLAMTTSLIASRLFFQGVCAPWTTLQSGDSGVQEVTNIKLSAAMSAGVFACSLYYPLMWLPGLVANIWVEPDTISRFDGIQQLFVGSDSNIGCLGAFVQTNSTSSGLVTGFMKTVYG
jgi:hypothetical protein